MNDEKDWGWGYDRHVDDEIITHDDKSVFCPRCANKIRFDSSTHKTKFTHAVCGRCFYKFNIKSVSIAM